MARTGHGHHIPGTVKVSEIENPKRCGGVNACPNCMTDVKTYNEQMHGEPVDYQDRAKTIVRNYIDAQRASARLPVESYTLYVSWFSKSLQNWKALVGTTKDDGLYFEVTHNGDKHETYLDAYTKYENVTISD